MLKTHVDTYLDTHLGTHLDAGLGPTFGSSKARGLDDPLEDDPWSVAHDLDEAGSGDLVEKVRQQLATCYHMRTRWQLKEMSFIVEATLHKLYEQDGYESTEQWLCAHLGIGFNKATEMVNIALMLEELPSLRKAFGEGAISYDHLRALVLVAVPENEDHLLEMTRALSVADTYRLARRIAALDHDDDAMKHEDRFVEMRWDKTRGCLVVHAELPPDQGAVFMRAVNELAKSLPDSPNPDGERTFIGAKRADALCEMASSALGASGSKPTIMVHVDAGTLMKSGRLDWSQFAEVGSPAAHPLAPQVNGIDASRGQDQAIAPQAKDTALGEGQALYPDLSDLSTKMPPEMPGAGFVTSDVLRHMTCDSIVQLVIDDACGAPYGLGRKRRTVNPRLSEGLRNRDQTCRWPGCTYRHNLEAHHIVPWSKLGTTDYDNLVSLCRIHHHAVENRGFKIRGKPPNIQIVAPDGRVIGVGPPEVPTELEDSFDAEYLSAMSQPASLRHQPEAPSFRA